MLSVIIINYNTRELTANAVRSVLGSSGEIPIEVIIFDNGSGDNSVHYLQRRFPGTRVIRSEFNLGFAKAVNRAAEQANGDYFWLVNSDCFVRSDAAAVLYSYMRENPDVAVVAGRLTNPDGTFQGSCRRFPTYSNILFSRGSPLSRIAVKTISYTHPDYPEPTEVEACALANAVIRREHFEAIGGFDERFFIYLEDTDLCKRLKDFGCRVVYHPGAESVHLWGVSFHGNLIQRYFSHHSSVAKYFRKHFAPQRLENSLFELMLQLWLGIRCMFAVMRGRV